MCSIGEEYIEEQGASKFMEPKEKFKFAGCKCNKCKEKKPCIVLRNKHVYCEICFLNSVTHKFRSYLGALRISYTNDKILILHRGGHQSTAMLHLLRSGLNLSRYKKIKVEPIVLYIENLFHLTVDERKQVLQEIEKEVTSFDFKLYIVSFSEYLLNNKVNFMTDCSNAIIMDNDKDIMNTIISKHSSSTVKSEILSIYEKKLITNVSEELNCKWIFTTKVAFNIASQILSDICLGKKSIESFNARKNIATNELQSNIKILAPFIDIEIKELAMYNFYNNLQPVVFCNENFNPFLNIQNLMKKFVEDLQISYPATITTIVKTGEKLTNKDKMVSGRCSLCEMPREDYCSEINSAESTHFSHWVSTQTPNYDISSPDRYRDLYNGFVQNKNSSEYCYRCSTIVKYINK